ncbi:IS200/IS605 family transposase [Dyadobacter frigoris]|uniref:IS200/IS605 family transposase n=1 Tax=Dyadobacter frigoris TaxID=2576211 RepID=A0A4U6D9C2_9BACT|nr:IS200/IS605 family transposase [Dyadobacter frigoris]TKT93225.1 IS200/IS605 family transposase [Dyadobacter frigoris]GLU54854.1 transposase [Dyadobacter frigoris]
MGNTYHQVYVHSVFAVKFRNAVISNAWKKDFIGVIGNLLNETGCKTYIVNGVEDHVHCLFGLNPAISISDVMRSVKAKSSKWVNESRLLQHRFEWQKGFGAFSYSHSQVDTIFKYIQNQEEHHKKRSFSEEYLELLTKFEVEHNKKYLFEDLM